MTMKEFAIVNFDGGETDKIFSVFLLQIPLNLISIILYFY